MSTSITTLYHCPHPAFHFWSTFDHFEWIQISNSISLISIFIITLIAMSDVDHFDLQVHSIIMSFTLIAISCLIRLINRFRRLYHPCLLFTFSFHWLCITSFKRRMHNYLLIGHDKLDPTVGWGLIWECNSELFWICKAYPPTSPPTPPDFT